MKGFFTNSRWLLPLYLNLMNALRMHVLEYIKIICEILAYFSAILFFVFKAYSGIFYAQLTLKLDCSKRFKLNGQENLVINLTLECGENAALDLHEISIRITYENCDPSLPFLLTGIERLEIEKSNKNLKIKIPWTLYKKDKYILSIKESTTFSEKVMVRDNLPCKVEAVVIASRKNSFKKIIKLGPTISHWRTSQISFPTLDFESNKTS